MRAVDTNVVVRWLITDDPEQSRLARQLLEGGVLILHTVLLEANWVLGSVYRIPREEIVAFFRGILLTEGVVTPNPEIIEEALRLAEAGVDFADAMHAATCPVDQLRSFDKDFVRRAKRAKTRVHVEGV